ncbi:MAG: acetate kinase, partial [Acidobacteria bacterium]
HGISHQYCARHAAQILGRDLASLRLITCHLGNGCSLAAIRDGRSVDTTMGFTPLEGLMMGTRSGSVDPGILIHLLRQQGCSAEKLDEVLNRESGLYGVSGVSGNMREVLAAMAKGNPRAKLAFDVYVHRLRSGSAAACESFAFLGLKLDREKNARSPADQEVSTADSAVRVLIVRTQEDWAIAQECWSWRRANAPPGAR